MIERHGKIRKVLDYIQTHKKGISSMQAFEMFGATRLSAIIYVLREEYDIEGIPCEGVDRYGNNVRFFRYVFRGEK
jgi:hypothetical protein